MSESGKEFVGGAGGAGAGLGALYVAGKVGFCAVGITTGLATLGAGSMVAGVFAVGAISYGGYKGTKYILDRK